MKKKLISSLLLIPTLLFAAACSNETAVLYDNEVTAQTVPIIENNSSAESLNPGPTSDLPEDALASTPSILSAESVTTTEPAVAETETDAEPVVINEAAFDETQDPISQSQAVDTATATSIPVSESEIILESQPQSEIASASVSESVTYNNQLAAQLLQEAAPLIHTASGNAFRSGEYFFVPVAISDTVVQIEVRRQSPDSQSHTNLMGIYRYDTADGQLVELDMQNNEWIPVGQ